MTACARTLDRETSVFSALRGFTDLEHDLLVAAGVWDALLHGPRWTVFAAVLGQGIPARSPAELASLDVSDVHFYGTVPTNPALVRASLVDFVVVWMEAVSLEDAAERALAARPEKEGGSRSRRWKGLPAELRAKARASWVRRTDAHIDFAARRIARLGRLWWAERARPVSPVPLEALAQDLVDVGRLRGSTERAARECTEAILANTLYLRDRMQAVVHKRLGHPLSTEEHELVLEVIRWEAQARMLE